MQPVTRLLAAALLLAGGAVHLDLWRGGYEGIPYIGPLFAANVVASALVALAVLVRFNPVVVVAGIALATGSLVALLLSRTVGLLGFMEAGWSPDALRTIAAEVGAVVTLALAVVVRSQPQHVPIPARVRGR
jgi:hypothetical protein